MGTRVHKRLPRSQRRHASKFTKRHKSMKAKQRKEATSFRRRVRTVKARQNSVKSMYENLKHSAFGSSENTTLKEFTTEKQNIAFRKNFKNKFEIRQTNAVLNSYESSIFNNKSSVKKAYQHSKDVIAKYRKNFSGKYQSKIDSWLSEKGPSVKTAREMRGFWRTVDKVIDAMPAGKGVENSPRIAQEATLYIGNGDIETVSMKIVHELLGESEGTIL